ncbi:MAG: polyprenyl diphosphate synthase [Candidatus Pacebacteria bacterium]|nr:polyprenyl diphosphate synthase [Candidatus Paceibacterota bacterium]
MDSEKAQNIPYHVGIIMDGNRRWAKEKGLPSLEGHRRGYEKVKKVGEWCRKKGVKILTLWAFSTENWNRAPKEVNYLMRLLKFAVSKKEIKTLVKDKIRLQIIGQRERLPKDLQKAIREAEEMTKEGKEGILNLALSYGGHAEIIEAIKKIIKKGTEAKDVTEELIDENLWTAGLSYPDLIIRTSGEQRTSGFLMWQSVYSELYFSKKHWPDFSEEDLDLAFADYGKRERRFGK